jgi:hypothetical protein
VANSKQRVAFALAGLGGFNAHGAGFLAAASDCNVIPKLVTATSGQIVILAQWLMGCDLEKAVINPDLEHNTLAQLTVAFGGEPGVFRPAYLESLKRWLRFPDMEHPFKALFDRLLPAEVYVPTRKPETFAAIADAFNNKAEVNGHPIGVVFNAYNLRTGQAVLFGNKAAKSHWAPKKKIPTATPLASDVGGETDEAELELQPITAQAVETALWLSLYGFDHFPVKHLMDGAYHRSCIVSELHTFDQVFVARPLAPGWRAEPPSNWFEVQDWQTEMWFSASYKAEVDTLKQINRLIEKGHLGHPFQPVKLIEIAPNAPAGFFHFFVEREKVYKEAYTKAVCAFKEYKKERNQRVPGQAS